jgi:hypothetical protein
LSSAAVVGNDDKGGGGLLFVWCGGENNWLVLTHCNRRRGRDQRGNTYFTLMETNFFLWNLKKIMETKKHLWKL